MRPKSGHDGATPSGNGMAALHLQRLGHLTGDPRYLEAAQRTLTLFAGELGRVPHAHATLIGALAEYRAAPAVVMLTGPPAGLAPWRAELDSRYLPGVLSLQLPQATSDLPAALDKPAASTAQAWICRGTHCLPPLDELQALVDTLTAKVE